MKDKEYAIKNLKEAEKSLNLIKNVFNNQRGIQGEADLHRAIESIRIRIEDAIENL